MNEVLPGVVHWTARHPNIGADVSSYLLVEERVLLNPLEPPAGLDAFATEGREPRHVLLTNRHHLRSAPAFAERFGARVHAPRPGMHDLPAELVEPFDFGDEVPGGGIAHHVLDEWPDETVIELPAHRALALADGVLNYGGLTFAPDEFLGDDPEEAKRLLRRAFGRIADELDFDHLLPAHGGPVVGDGRMALRRFATG